MNNTNLRGGDEFLDPKKILLNFVKLGYGQKVADLGCGAMGYFCIESAKIVGETGQVYAVDILKDVLSSVEGRARVEGIYNIKSIWSDLEHYGATNIQADSLDVAMLINTLFQTKKHLEVIRESHRLLKIGGKLILIEWQKKSTPFGPPQNLRLEAEQAIEYAEMCGFTLKKEFIAGPYHYGLVFIK